MTVSRFLLVGLIAWGLPAFVVAGPQVLPVLALATLPLLFASSRPPTRSDTASDLPDHVVSTVCLIAIVYLFADALFGRQKFELNLFLSDVAVERFVDQANAGVSQGRGIIDLVGAVMAFLPFAMIDLARRTSAANRVLLVAIGLLLVFYEAGISRGYLLIATASLLIGLRLSFFRAVAAALISLAVFFVASAFRGDFEETAFANPLFDAAVFPYINLALMLDADCGSAAWTDYVMEFAKKFLPGFLVAKDIFSFNVEMTLCIYPGFGVDVQSISIFTWMGEMFFYGPSEFTGLAAGVILASLAFVIDRQLVAMKLDSVRLFSGMMCIVLLRSRVLDVASFLIFLILFLVAARMLLAISQSSMPADSGQASGLPGSAGHGSK